MRTRLTCLLLGILGVPTFAFADFHKVDFYDGGSLGNGASTLFGIHTSIGLREPAKLPRRLTWVIPDLSVQIGSHDGTPVTQFASLFGARILATSYGKNCGLFGQVLAGNVYQNDSVSTDHNNGALSFGVGFEAFKGAAQKVEVQEKDQKKTVESHYGWGFRADFDYITRSGDRKDFWRASAGIVYRFARRHQ
jgi:hypothetical protein